MTTQLILKHDQLYVYAPDEPYFPSEMSNAENRYSCLSFHIVETNSVSNSTMFPVNFLAVTKLNKILSLVWMMHIYSQNEQHFQNMENGSLK